MSANDTGNKNPVFHYENGVPVFYNERFREIEYAQEEAKKRDAQYRDAQLLVNKWVMRFTGVLAGVAIIGGGISAWQAHIASQTISEMKAARQQTATDNAAAISAQQLIAQSALTASQKNFEESVKQSQESFRLDQRAWVGIDFSKLSGEWSNDKKQITFTADAIIKNTGKTPALHMSIFRGISFIKPWNQSLDYDKEWAANLMEKERKEKDMLKGLAQNEALSKGTPAEGFGTAMSFYIGTSSSDWKSHGLVLSPGATHPLPFLVDKTLPDPNQDPRYRRLIPQTIYWLGRITYTDIFSTNIHTTKICLRFAAGNLELCPDGGNSMD